ncbi:hypothetical protein BBP40_010556 [Aspergillus hancockii]|nr:hypothetical protein BBP40_010556 [Aspergillus hancockii]
MATQTITTETKTPASSFFDVAPYIPPDAIFALTAQYNADTFPQKVNLGQGTYRDENGQPWVLLSVQQAREKLVSQGLYHEYLPILGLQTFRNEATKLALGSELYDKQKSKIGSIMKDKKLFPLFDAAYLGFNSGSVDDDAFAMRYFVDDLQMEAAGCLSFAKNMGLYGERVGCLFVAVGTQKAATNTQSVLEMLQRSEVSNPPAYGAKIASTILSDDSLKNIWYADLITMSGRIRSMRRALYDALIQYGASGTWDHLIRQSGMFGFLGLSPAVVQQLKDKHHVYMAGNSRISIAGLNPSNVEYVARSIAECLNES